MPPAPRNAASSARPATPRCRWAARSTRCSTATSAGRGSTCTTGGLSSADATCSGRRTGPRCSTTAPRCGAPGPTSRPRLVTEAPLTIAGTRVEPGEYTLFIDLSDEVWTFIVSTWPAQETYDYENREALFGAFEYTDDRDVLRTPMELETLPVAFDQLSWQFLDMTASGGRLALLWDTKVASVAFTVAD